MPRCCTTTVPGGACDSSATSVARRPRSASQAHPLITAPTTQTPAQTCHDAADHSPHTKCPTPTVMPLNRTGARERCHCCPHFLRTAPQPARPRRQLRRTASGPPIGLRPFRSLPPHMPQRARGRASSIPSIQCPSRHTGRRCPLSANCAAVSRRWPPGARSCAHGARRRAVENNSPLRPETAGPGHLPAVLLPAALCPEIRDRERLCEGQSEPSEGRTPWRAPCFRAVRESRIRARPDRRRGEVGEAREWCRVVWWLLEAEGVANLWVDGGSECTNVPRTGKPMVRERSPCEVICASGSR